MTKLRERLRDYAHNAPLDLKSARQIQADLLEIAGARRQSVPGCSYCDRELADGITMFPPHDASERCESGKRNHCSCGICF